MTGAPLEQLDARGNGHTPPAEIEFPRTLDIELNPPLADNKQTYTTLHLEEPTVKMMTAAERELNNGALQSVQSIRAYHSAALSQVTGIPRQVLENMRVSEFDRAIAFLAPYLITGQVTGAS